MLSTSRNRVHASAYSAEHAPARKKVTAGKGTIVLKMKPARPVNATVVIKASGAPLPYALVGVPHASLGDGMSISALPQGQQRGPVVVRGG